MIIGYLGRDPEMRFTPSGKSVTNFSVACDHSWKRSDGEINIETEWFNIVAWGSLAEFSKQTLQKDDLVYVEGRLQTRVWQDNQGTQHNSAEIVAREILALTEYNDQNEIDALEDTDKYLI
jgi:single-strand DNA-binding protein